MIEHWLQLGPAERLVLISYVSVMGLLAIYGLHRYWMVFAPRSRPSPPPPLLGDDLPMVTVQLPVFNEKTVINRLLDAVVGLDWPRDRLHIQVLDDSTDETTDLIRARVATLREAGIDIDHLTRTDRSGFKAGALAAGLASAKGDLVAIFDADFAPLPNLLRGVIPHFADPGVGMVQVRWEHLNRRESLLTQLQAVLLDGHFLVDHASRAARGRFFNFNGTAGVWRRRAIEDAGGWQSDTLTEDLDLSYRAQLRGWRFVYRADLVAPAELPSDMNAFKGQQHRWAKGSAQSAIKLLPEVMKAPIPFGTKVEAFFHLTGNFAYPLLLALALLAYPALEVRYRGGWTQTLWLDLPFFLLGTVSLAFFYREPLRRVTTEWTRWLMLPALMALGMGMTINNGRAVVAGLLGHKSDFNRTAKRGDAVAGQRRYRTLPQFWVAAELLLGTYFAYLVVRAINHELYLSVPFLCLFSAGFIGTAVLSLREQIGFGRRLRPHYS